MNRGNFGDLLTPIHRKIIFDAYNSKPEQYTELFSVIDMNKKDETFPHVYGMGTWSTNNEGETFNTDAMEDGPNATLTAVRYDKSYAITWELVRDDLYNVMRGVGKGGSAKGLAKGLKDAIERLCAGIINGGFATACYDGQYLFDNDHPTASTTGGTVVDNLVSGACSDTTVKSALTLLRAQVDGAGMKINCVADILFGAANLEYTIYSILESSGPAGSLSNDKNVLPRLRPVINDYLTDSYWGVKDSSVENLVFGWRDKPIFDSEKIPNTMDWRMYGYSRFDADAIDFRGMVASNGT